MLVEQPPEQRNPPPDRFQRLLNRDFYFHLFQPAPNLLANGDVQVHQSIVAGPGRGIRVGHGADFATVAVSNGYSCKVHASRHSPDGLPPLLERPGLPKPQTNRLELPSLATDLSRPGQVLLHLREHLAEPQHTGHAKDRHQKQQGDDENDQFTPAAKHHHQHRCPGDDQRYEVHQDDCVMMLQPTVNQPVVDMSTVGRKHRLAIQHPSNDRQEHVEDGQPQRQGREDQPHESRHLRCEQKARGG